MEAKWVVNCDGHVRNTALRNLYKAFVSNKCFEGHIKLTKSHDFSKRGFVIQLQNILKCEVDDSSIK